MKGSDGAKEVSFFEAETELCIKRTAALQQRLLADQSDLNITNSSKRRTPPPSAAR
jgi:hypothetical protein